MQQSSQRVIQLLMVFIVLGISAFILGTSREVKTPAEVSKRMVQKLKGKNEFTVLATLKQDHLNSGVIFSIHHSEHRYVQSIVYFLFYHETAYAKWVYYSPLMCVNTTKIRKSKCILV